MACSLCLRGRNGLALCAHTLKIVRQCLTIRKVGRKRRHVAEPRPQALEAAPSRPYRVRRRTRGMMSIRGPASRGRRCIAARTAWSLCSARPQGPLQASGNRFRAHQASVPSRTRRRSPRPWPAHPAQHSSRWNTCSLRPPKGGVRFRVPTRNSPPKAAPSTI